MNGARDESMSSVVRGNTAVAHRPALLRALAAHAAGWSGGAALVLLCLAAYLPGLSAVPPLDGDESRYAEAAREILGAGDWREIVVPHVGGAPRLNKPPLVYWLEALSAFAFSGGRPAELSFPAALKHDALGEPTLTGSPTTRTLPFSGGIWTYRLPSVLATIAAVLITWRIGLAMFAPQAAWLGAALLGGCYLVVLDARLARTDQILLACTCAAQCALWRIWRRDAPAAPLRWVLLFWIGIALGILVKGPVTPGVAALTIAALCVVTGRVRWLRRLRIGAGLALVAAVVLMPAALAAGVVGTRPVVEAFARELLERGLTAEGERAGPPGYHLALLFGLFWPGALLAVPALLWSVRRGLRWGVATADPRSGCARGSPHRFVRAGRPAELFCLAWLAPSWLALELIGTKLPHYPLPLYPALALLCGRAAWAGAKGALPLMRSRAAALGDAVWLLIGFGLLVALPIALAWMGQLRREPGAIVALAATFAVLAALLVTAWRLIRRRSFVPGLLVGLAACVLGGRELFESVLPNLSAPWMSSAVVRQLAAIDPYGTRPIAAAGYPRESLMFLTGGRVERIAPSRLDGWFDEHPDGLAVVDGAVKFAKHSTRSLATVEGFDYVEGRHMVLNLVELRPH